MKTTNGTENWESSRALPRLEIICLAYNTRTTSVSRRGVIEMSGLVNIDRSEWLCAVRRKDVVDDTANSYSHMFFLIFWLWQNLLDIKVKKKKRLYVI